MKKLSFLFLIPSISLLIWAMNFLVLGREWSLDLINTYMGQIFGVLAFSFIAVNFILATRLNFVEAIFGGYDKVYKYHLYTGRIVGALILLHPLMLMFRLVFDINSFFKALSIYFVPNFQNIAYTTGIIGFWGVNFLIFLTVGVKLPYHIWKQTHRPMIIFFLIISWHVLLQLNSQTFFYSLWLIFLVVIGILSFLYREIIYEYFLYSKFYVKKIKKLGNVTEFILDDTTKKFKFIPGQFGIIAIKNNNKISSESHPYTFSSAPSQNLRISAKNLGDYSSKLVNLQEGDQIRIWGPHGMFGQSSYGRLIFPSKMKTVMIAGGIGITPFLSIINEFALNQSKYKQSSEVYLISSCKVPQDNIYREEIEKLSSSISFLKYIEHCSDEEGYISLEYLKKVLGPNLKDYNFMICGPTGMMNSVRKILHSVGVKKSQIFFEDFSFK